MAMGIEARKRICGVAIVEHLNFGVGLTYGSIDGWKHGWPENERQIDDLMNE